VFAFLVKKESMTLDQFNSYWLTDHRQPKAEPGSSDPPPPSAGSMFTGYIQNHLAEAGPPTGPVGALPTFDGYAEFWLPDVDAWRSLVTTPGYEAGKADEANFLACRPEHVVTQDRVVRAPERAHDVRKLVLLFRRPRGARVEDFRQTWSEARAASVPKIVPGLRGYVQSQVVEDAYSFCEPRYDGVEELWISGDFDQAAQALVSGLDELVEGPITAVAVREHVIVEPSLA
jgi:hypothetical protein